MKHKSAFGSAVICILFVSSIVFISQISFGDNNEQKQFLVGVTYCGTTVKDAKLLIDKVSNYTNLFVIQSGFTIIGNNTAVNEIGDYAVSKGLHFAAASAYGITDATWISAAEKRWGKMFAGVYFEDEPGGKMLDGDTLFTNSIRNNGEHIALQKYLDGTVYYSNDDRTVEERFYPNGTIEVSKFNGTAMFASHPSNISKVEYAVSNNTIYYPDGSIIMAEALFRITINNNDVGNELIDFNVYTMENGSDHIAQAEPYQQVKTHNPLGDCNAAANRFIDKTSSYVEELIRQRNLNGRSFPIFTSDYALYWWDLQSGYDMVLAEFAWNNSVSQEISLARGAANLQGKSWGTIITWKYTHAPYLTNGAEMFEQVKASYKAGAEYVVVFNYAQDMSGPFGILQEEHFQALERFWKEVVQNPAEGHGSDKAEAVLVLPKNYGWGMRNPDDVIWGIWEPNATSTQIWNQVQSKLDQYCTKLDIVYDDPAFPVVGKYPHIYFWNKT